MLNQTVVAGYPALKSLNLELLEFLQGLDTRQQVTFIVLPLLYMTWRLWMFTVKPWLWPDDPKDLPYWIPCKLPPSSRKLFRL